MSGTEALGEISRDDLAKRAVYPERCRGLESAESRKRESGRLGSGRLGANRGGCPGCLASRLNCAGNYTKLGSHFAFKGAISATPTAQVRRGW
jgi:hypothetical protein